jgi:hypothetical protein
MKNMKTVALLFAIGIAFSLARAQSTAPKGSTALPTVAEVDASMKRTFGYDPSISCQILDIHPSVIPAIAEVIVAINKQDAVYIYVRPEQSIQECMTQLTEKRVRCHFESDVTATFGRQINS